MAHRAALGGRESLLAFEVAMLLNTPLAIGVFLLGAASGALLVSLRYLAFRNKIRAEVAEDLRLALFPKYRGASPGSRTGGEPATGRTDPTVEWP